MQLKKKQNGLAVDLFFCAAFLAAAALLVWKCRYGFGKEDESFYLTIPYRFLQGDGLFVHEWHMSQMASVFLLPFVALFMRVTGGTEGIILAARYCFTAVWMLGAVLLYLRMRKTTKVGGGVAALCLSLYAPFGLMALSYNTIGILSLTLSLVLLCTHTQGKKADLIGSGACFAAAVLCCPYLLGIYAVYTVGWFVYILRRREGKKENLRVWLLFTLGAAIPAALFAGVVFSRASVSDVLSAIPIILNDAEHGGVDLVQKMTGYITDVLYCSPYSAYVFFALACTFVLSLVVYRQKTLHVCCLSFAVFLVIVLILVIRICKPYINYFMFPLTLFPVFLLPLLPKERTMRRWMLFGYLPGMLYTVCLYVSSNTRFYAISSACSVALVSSVVVLALYVRSVWESEAVRPLRLACLAAAAVLLCVQVGVQTGMRCRSVFLEKSMQEQTELVTEGVEKGVRTRPQQAQIYAQVLEETASIRQDADVRSVLCLSYKTWIYLLDGGKEIGSYSAWLSGGVNAATLERLDAYYDLHPDKKPDAVYYEWNAFPEERAVVTEWIAQRFGFEESEVGVNGSVFR